MANTTGVQQTIPPIEAWSDILDQPRVQPIEHANPAVGLWSVETANSELSYLIRSFGPWRAGASFADECRVQAHLLKLGTPLAPPIVTDDGRLCVRDGDESYVLIARLPVEQLNIERSPNAESIAFKIGAAIGQLHLDLASYPWPVRSFEHDILKATFGDVYAKLPADVRARTIGRHYRHVESALSDLPPMQLIHGDCNSGNVLVHDGVVTGIIDLDHLPLGHRIYDLADYLGNRARAITAITASPAEREAQSTAFLATIHAYCAGYHHQNPLSEREWDALPSALMAAEIAGTSWSHLLLTELPERARPNECEQYEHGVRTLEWLTDNFDQLTEAISNSK